MKHFQLYFFTKYLKFEFNVNLEDYMFTFASFVIVTADATTKKCVVSSDVAVQELRVKNSARSLPFSMAEKTLINHPALLIIA